MISYIALGSNLDDPVSQVETALTELDALPKTQLLKRSTLYHTAPVGPQDQPDFVNAVAKIRTQLDPFELFAACQALEAQHHRVKTIHWGPRTLDLDILWYNALEISTEALNIPHPRMWEREFVMKPLQEITLLRLP